MAFVIFSTGSLTSSSTRTFSLRSVLLGFMASIVCASLIGLQFGRWLTVADIDEPVPLVVQQLPTPTAGPTRVLGGIEPRGHLLERFGEMSGRVIQLETEAANLAARIDAVKEFEERIKPQETLDLPLGRPARTQPGMPSGGPLIEPLGSSRNAATSGLRARDTIEDQMSRLESDLERLANVFSLFDERVMTSAHEHMSFPGRTPVLGVAINSGFGNRRDPISRKRAFHSGVDYAAPRGTTIRASAGGRVIYSGSRPHYGLTVEIDHGGGLVTRYAHASRLLVSLGEVVMPLQEIALIGSTGRSTGPHLHFEVLKDGHFVDPAIYLSRF